uniref:Family with sequence similarity 131 member C n=1 Tax=Chelydra serpentina TaxID=8475 RepID=A0A8C3XRF3_CHESE
MSLSHLPGASRGGLIAGVPRDSSASECHDLLCSIEGWLKLPVRYRDSAPSESCIVCSVNSLLNETCKTAAASGEIAPSSSHAKPAARSAAAALQGALLRGGGNYPTLPRQGALHHPEREPESEKGRRGEPQAEVGSGRGNGALQFQPSLSPSSAIPVQGILQSPTTHLGSHSHSSPVSALGLVQTIKDHITKPTAMARGRVAHLIEWKGWSAPQAGGEPWLTEEEHYSYLTDELREARFAAGVAEQFAITEATLSAWSSLADEEMNYGGSSQEIVQLQGSFPVLSAMSSPAGLWSSPALPADSSEKEQACAGREQEGAAGVHQKRLSSSLHYVDSSSLSEDEVFYN